MQDNNKKNGQQGLFVFECVMAVIYLVMAFTLLFTKLFDNSIPEKNIRLFLGILLGLYGVFRVFRAIRKSSQRKNDIDS